LTVWGVITLRLRRFQFRAEARLGPAGHRPALLLAHVVGPATAVDALAAGERGESEEAAVDRVGVEPVFGSGAHQDHGTTLRLLRVLRELTADTGGRRRGDAC